MAEIQALRAWASASRAMLLGATALVSVCAADPASAQQPAQQQPNILFIMGDDIGWMQPSIYHEGLAVGETPNIDRIGHEGGKFRPTMPCRVARLGGLLSLPVCSRCASAWFCRKFPGARPTCGQVHPHSPSSCSISATPQASSARTISEITPRRSRRRTGSRNFGAISITSMPCSR